MGEPQVVAVQHQGLWHLPAAEAASPIVQSLSFCVLFVLAALPSCFVWLTFGATVQRILQTERATRSFNVVMGLLLARSVVLFIW